MNTPRQAAFTARGPEIVPPLPWIEFLCFPALCDQ